MKSYDILQLLNTLSAREDPMSAEACAKLLNVSCSLVKKRIRELKGVLEDHGCAIVGKSGHGNGYGLDIGDPALYEAYIQEVLPEEIEKEKQDFNERSNRVRYISQFLLGAGDYVKSEELAEELAVSRSQFSKDLLLVKRNFEQYGVELISKAHHGIKIKADEKSIRLCLANDYMNHVHLTGGKMYMDSSRKFQEELKTISEIILDSAECYGYPMTDILVQNLTVHIYVAIKRMAGGNPMKVDDKLRRQVLNSEEKPLAERIVRSVEETFHISFDKEELCYIIMHLSAKHAVSENCLLDEEVMEIIEEMLLRIKEKYGLDLTRNLDLILMLGIHTLPLLKRVKYKIALKNPLLGEIKSNLYFAYEMALCACSVINERFHCTLSQDEIAYYALSLKVAMDELRNHRKKNVLLVCSSGRGSTQLLKYDFQKKFGEQLERVETCNLFELDKLDLSSFDCVFSTVPVQRKLPVPVFRIKYFLDDDSEKLVHRVLCTQSKAERVKSYFKRNMFQGCLKADSKKEALESIVKEAEKKQELPEHFLEAVLRREQLEDTQLAPLVAMPHPDGAIVKNELISVNVLQKPVFWGKNEVQLVILIALSPNFVKSDELFFEFIAEFIHDKSMVNKLINASSFEVLQSIVDEVCRRE